MLFNIADINTIFEVKYYLIYLLNIYIYLKQKKKIVQKESFKKLLKLTLKGKLRNKEKIKC